METSSKDYLPGNGVAKCYSLLFLANGLLFPVNVAGFIPCKGPVLQVSMY